MLLLSVQRDEPPHPDRLQAPGGPVQKSLETEKTTAFAQEEEAEAADDDGPVAVQDREFCCWAHARGVGGGGEEAER